MTRVSVAEMFALLLKSGIGAGLPLGNAQFLANSAAAILSDPALIGDTIDALNSDQRSVEYAQTETVLRFQNAQVLMVAPMVADALGGGARTVVLQALDYPNLLLALLHQAQSVQRGYFQIAVVESSVEITKGSNDQLGQYAAKTVINPAALEALKNIAAKTFVPASEASRVAGAGAGLTDND